MTSVDLLKLEQLISDGKILTAKDVLLKHDKSSTWLKTRVEDGEWSSVVIGRYCLYARNKTINGDLDFFNNLPTYVFSANQYLDINGKSKNRHWLLTEIKNGDLKEIKVTDKINIYCKIKD